MVQSYKDPSIHGQNPNYPNIVEEDMKNIAKEMDLRKPKTNDGGHRKRKQPKSYVNPDSAMDPNL